ncbi:SUMF1/EgtB/PvdO family nonheme iron enzyme [Pacificimonas sp. WHA3]|uniref:SUMF1/EgtB/PvdO family nonheme iron enzyme n=1 Tax=Pacificimonas pallii TaxID=2827236 RepID=A0ABS6SAN2_9SPHN|nr:SUMF1/EgtB/PvdO family nonheme iron enzyme [Pacificimonas pallii]MBV7255270.1 SUMF1/EgtB/PvdO family nonheme iron enzyme [Pacificimonas pallii]
MNITVNCKVAASVLSLCLAAFAVAPSATAREIIVCPAAEAVGDACDFLAGKGLQEAVRSAVDGDTVRIRKGMYRFPEAFDRPFQPDPAGTRYIMRAGLVIENKSLAISAEKGAVIDNHEGTAMTAIYVNRASVRIDGLELRNFLYEHEEDDVYDGHGIFAYDAQLTLRKITVENARKMAVTGRGRSILDIDYLAIPTGHVGLWLRESSIARMSNAMMDNMEVASVAIYANTAARIHNSYFGPSVYDGVYAADDASIYITNSIFEGNKPYAIHADGSSVITGGHLADINNEKFSHRAEEARLSLTDVITADAAGVDHLSRIRAGSPLIGKGEPDPVHASRRPTYIGPGEAIGSLLVPELAPDCENCPEMAVIPGGIARIGLSIDRSYGKDIHGPTHDVEIRPFAMAKHEVTLSAYRTFVEETGRTRRAPCFFYDTDTPWHIEPGLSWDNPKFGQDGDHPVLCVSWEDAGAYAAWLSDRSGKPYRLPSEAEWEFLAATGGLRAGDTGEAITHELANIGAPVCCSGAVAGRDVWLASAPVGSFPADDWGLFDLRGNAYEWQADCYAENYLGAPGDSSARTNCSSTGQRVTRGGSFNDYGEYFANSFRVNAKADSGYFTLGFRVARDFTDQEMKQLRLAAEER